MNTCRSRRTEFAPTIESNTNSIPSLWIKSLALFRPRVNPITFFDSRLLAGTHTRLPSDRSVRERFASLVTSRGTDVRTVLRSRADSKRDCGLPAVASIRACATTETYETITKSDFAPRGDQLRARGPKKCRGLAKRAPTLCNGKIVTSL